MGSTKRKSPPFVMLYRAMLNSKEWKELTHSEMIAYIYIKKNYKGSNNGKILFPYSGMKNILAKRTLCRALQGLIKKGWIEKTKCGGLYRFYCLYKLTGRFDKAVG